MTNNKITIHRILKHHNGGVGFKITFPDNNTANKYKDMIYWIIKNDGYIIKCNKGIMDKKEMKK